MKIISKSASLFFMTLAITLIAAPLVSTAHAKALSALSLAALSATPDRHHSATCRQDWPPPKPADDPDNIDSCQKSCTIDADCGIGGSCNTGVCEHKTNYCLNDRWSVNERGEVWNCDAYRCDSAHGECFRQATANENCTSGYVFDGKNSCVPSVNCAENDPSCQDIYQRWLKARHDYEAQTPQPSPPVFSCISCETHSDCDSTQMCWQNRCTKAALYCADNSNNGEQAVFDKNGVVVNCGNYACDPIAKACFTACQAKQDCNTGNACVSGFCQPQSRP